MRLAWIKQRFTQERLIRAGKHTVGPSHRQGQPVHPEVATTVGRRPKWPAMDVALACNPAPEGHDHWTLRLLAGEGGGVGVGVLHVPRGGPPAAEKNALKPWQKKEWCIPKVSAEFVAHMEDVLDLYAQPYDPRRPVVCFDETSTQLLADTRPPLPAQPGRPARQDYEYRREGTRNLFLTCEPMAGWRHVQVTERRTMQDFARRVAKRLEFHYTPKHGSWLNMAEIEFSVLSRSCLKQRVPNEPALRREVQALVTERNAARATINWRFNTQDARGKLHRLYPFDSKHD